MMKVVLVDSAPAMAAVLILTLSIIWILQKMFNPRATKDVLPPGPRGLPIVGNLPFLRRDLHRQLAELAAEYGPIYKLRLGSKIITVVSSADLTKEVVRDHDAVMANRQITAFSRIITYGLKDIAWSPYGQEWRDRRKIFVREMQSNTNLNASYNLRKDEVRKAIRDIHAQIGTPVHIFELVQKIDINLLINLIWGSRIQGQRRDKMISELVLLVSEMLRLLVKPNVSDFFPVLARFDLQGVARDTTAIVKKVEAIMEDAIDERIKKPHAKKVEEGRKDFLQTLVDLMQDESNQQSLDMIQIKAMLINILLGGTTTTATTVEWTITELIRNPSVMKKVQQELDEVVGVNDIVEESHATKLVYLDAVLKESLRVHPIGPLLTPKRPSQSCTVGGYTIPKDSTVFVNAYSIHRDPAGWDNPLEFRPERFFDGKCDFNGNNFNYVPFGSGRRICAGLPLAERMVKYITATLLHSFEWRLPVGEELDMSDHLTASLRKRIPLAALPVPRLPSSDLYR
nr:CYP706V2 protein [Isodon rubescens]